MANFMQNYAGLYVGIHIIIFSKLFTELYYDMIESTQHMTFNNRFYRMKKLIYLFINEYATELGKLALFVYFFVNMYYLILKFQVLSLVQLWNDAWRCDIIIY